MRIAKQFLEGKTLFCPFNKKQHMLAYAEMRENAFYNSKSIKFKSDD